jgi:hypothetical protein
MPVSDMQPLLWPAQAKQQELASRRQQLSGKVEQLSASAGQVATPSRSSKVAAELSDASQELDILTSILVRQCTVTSQCDACGGHISAASWRHSQSTLRSNFNAHDALT